MRAFLSSRVTRSRLFVSAGCAGVFSLVLTAIGACGGAPANYPDSSGVVAAQASWCQALAKIQGAGDSWEHMSSCKGAYPTASAAFLKGMTTCYQERIEAAGDSAPDSGQIMSDCTEEVVVKMPADEAGGAEIIEARCKRAERCEQPPLNVPVPECKAAVAKLESSQRALFTTRFNAAALHEISECLSSKSCSSDNEDAAIESCYKPAEEELLWFPR